MESARHMRALDPKLPAKAGLNILSINGCRLKDLLGKNLDTLQGWGINDRDQTSTHCTADARPMFSPAVTWGTSTSKGGGWAISPPPPIHIYRFANGGTIIACMRVAE